MDHVWFWVAFNLFVFGMLAADLGIFHRRAHAVSVREAAVWSAICIAAALSFNAGIWWFMGSDKALEFLTGYLIEQALSVDNIFVFVLIFSYFAVPPQYQHRILFWGIFGALLLRGTMIATGAYLIHTFHWITYVFGAFLVITGIRMATQDEQGIEPEANPAIRLVRRFLPVSNRYDGQRFFTPEPVGPGGATRYVATPLFVVLVLVETTDVIFAVDSIPAIFAVTTDSFIVYTSNVFAILGLRALYFVLAGVVQRFHYLQIGLSVVLVFVGAKMLLADIYKMPIGGSLAIVGGILASSVAASLLFPARAEELSPVVHDPLAPAPGSPEKTVVSGAGPAELP